MSKINKEAFNTLKDIMGVDVNFLLENYLNTSSKILQDSREDFESKNYDALKIKVHSLKSSSMQVGAMELGEKAKEIELDIIENRLQGLDTKIYQLKEMFPAIELEIKKLMSE